MKHRALLWCCLVLWMAGPAATLAQTAPATAEDVVDARLEGYVREANTYQRVSVDGDASLVWFLLVGLGVVGLAGLFKDAKRTHLD